MTCSSFSIPGRTISRELHVVPHQLRDQILEESHQAALGGHFTGKRTYLVLAPHSSVQWLFQIMGVDMMDLPATKRGSQHGFSRFHHQVASGVLLPDQTQIHIAKVPVEEVVPLFGVQEPLLPDQVIYKGVNNI